MNMINMINRLCIFVLAVLTSSMALAQFSNTANRADGAYENIPQEGVYVHHSSSLLFAGERLYFSVYCLNLETHTLSDLSKIAYVSLTDQDKNLIISQKIRLQGGKGQGDFAVPAEVSTGSYKLIAYTTWMKSRTDRQFFESDVLIINPYKTTSEEFLDKAVPDSVNVDSLSTLIDIVEIPIKEEITYGDHLLSLSTNKDSYNLREAVQLEIRSLRPDLSGEYSISTRRVDTILPTISETEVNYWRENTGNIVLDKGNKVLPELRGELISGLVLDRENGQATANKTVVLSLPGSLYILDVARTDENGRFYFNLDSAGRSNVGIFQILDEDPQNYKIEIEEHKSPSLNSLEFRSFSLNRSQGQTILERSIHNQIENAYGIVKSDTLITANGRLPFYRDYQQVYYLDDFTRFNTLRETMVEIVDHAWISENGEEDPTFGVRPFDGYLDAGALLPLVTIDGLFIQAHKDIVDFNSKELRRISLSRDRYVIGPEVFQGLLALETKTGDFQESFFRDFLLNTNIQRPEPVRAYYFQRYLAANESARIPDFRYQLYWNPSLRLESDVSTIQFYTSDIKGTFEVELKGYTRTGEPITVRTNFIVE